MGCIGRRQHVNRCPWALVCHTYVCIYSSVYIIFVLTGILALLDFGFQILCVEVYVSPKGSAVLLVAVAFKYPIPGKRRQADSIIRSRYTAVQLSRGTHQDELMVHIKMFVSMLSRSHQLSYRYLRSPCELDTGRGSRFALRAEYRRPTPYSSTAVVHTVLY